MKKFKITLNKFYKGSTRNQVRYVNCKNIEEAILVIGMDRLLNVEEV